MSHVERTLGHPPSAFRPVLADGALSGLRAWVTGAGSGIGRAIALRLAQLGADVGGCGRHADTLAQTQALAEAAGGRFSWSACDLRDTAAAAAAIEAFARDGGLQGLVHNAGGQFHARAEDISPRGFAAVVDLNLNALFAATRAAHPFMAQRGGSIVSLSISPVERGALGLAHGVAARSGVAGLTRALALEWGAQGIRVNCLAPGAVDTDAFLAKSGAGASRAIGLSTPLGRNAGVAEVAETAAFLLSPAAALITGQVLRIDGGMFLGAPLDLRPPAPTLPPVGERPALTPALSPTREGEQCLAGGRE